MSPIKLNGSTSGFVALDAPAAAGSNTLVLPTGNGSSGQYLQTNGSGVLSWAGITGLPAQALTSSTAVASTSGTSIDFTSIPSTVKRITVMFDGVSTNGSTDFGLQLGTGSTPTYATSGYSGGVGNIGGGGLQFPTSYAQILYSGQAALIASGNAVIALIGSNKWAINGSMGSNSTYVHTFGYSITLSAALTAVRIKTGNGTDTFDAGNINIIYEG